MLLRLILTAMLVLGALATPVAAPCHGATASAFIGTAHTMRNMPAMPEKTTSMHVCVGCIPPSNWFGARIAAPIVPARALPVARVAQLDLARGGPPALPPPRFE